MALAQKLSTVGLELGQGQFSPVPVVSLAAVMIGNCPQGLRLRGASCTQPIIEIIEISLCLGQLVMPAISRTDVWYMVRRRAADAGIETAIGCHTFRATGITDYLTNGGRIEVAQRMAGHSNAKTTGLYDRRNDDVSVGEVERIGI
jgi:integrase